ncbi:MAG TPA: alpha/beta hydrolase [Roseiflexaceae bacterium]|nr:alpha/beta hydrolase [Roseiflexaceae bacterium]
METTLSRGPFGRPAPLWRGLRLALTLLAVALAGGLGWFGWSLTPINALPQTTGALRSDALVRVATDPWLTFEPAAEPRAGLILYPGGRVDAQAYAPAARAIAEQGFLVVIVPMPLNLSLLGADRAQEVIAAFPAVRSWAIGGHSLGGTSAADFAAAHPDVVEGLVLWASYPQPSADLSASGLATVQIVGGRDGVVNAERLAGSRTLLPPDTRRVTIAGGNHAQFGWYGPQSGDQPATISPEEQQRQTVAATVALLDRIATQ